MSYTTNDCGKVLLLLYYLLSDCVIQSLVKLRNSVNLVSNDVMKENN